MHTYILHVCTVAIGYWSVRGQSLFAALGFGFGFGVLLRAPNFPPSFLCRFGRHDDTRVASERKLRSAWASGVLSAVAADWRRAPSILISTLLWTWMPSPNAVLRSFSITANAEYFGSRPAPSSVPGTCTACLLALPSPAGTRHGLPDALRPSARI